CQTWGARSGRSSWGDYARCRILECVLSHPSKDMDLKGAAVAVLISVLWGANTVVIKMGLEEAPPLRLACMRFVVGGAVICLWAWATGRFAGFRIEPAEWRPLALLGLLFSVQMAATNVGTWLTSAAHASVLINLYAVHTVVLAHFLIPGDRLTLRKLGGVLIAYAGIILLFARQIGRGAPTLLGDAIMVVSAFVLAERTVYLAGAVRRFDPVKLLLSQALIGTTIFVVVSLVFEPSPTRRPRRGRSRSCRTRTRTGTTRSR